MAEEPNTEEPNTEQTSPVVVPPDPKPLDFSRLRPSETPDNPTVSLASRLKNWEFLAHCYDVLKIDPLDLETSAKSLMAFDFGEFENIPDQTASKPKALIYTPATGGKSEQKTEQITSSYDFQRYFASNSSLSISDPTGAAFSASLSKSYKDTAKQTGTEKRTITIASKTVRCYRLELDQPTRLTLAEEFRRAVADLPDDDDEASRADYDRLVVKFGTHYAQAAMMGGRAYQFISLSKSTYLSLIEHEVDLKTEASASLEALKLDASHGEESKVSDMFKNALTKSEEWTTYSGGTPQSPDFWTLTVEQHPAPIEVRLAPLHELVTETFFDDEAVASKRERLKQATERYIERSQGEDPARYRLNYGDEVELQLAVEGPDRFLCAQNPKFATTRARKLGGPARDESILWRLVNPSNPEDRAPIAQGGTIALLGVATGEYLDARQGSDDRYAKGEGLAAVKGKDPAQESAQWAVVPAGQREREGKAVVSGDYVKLYRQWRPNEDGGVNCLLGEKKATDDEQKVFSFGKKKSVGTNWVISKVGGIGGLVDLGRP